MVVEVVMIILSASKILLAEESMRLLILRSQQQHILPLKTDHAKSVDSAHTFHDAFILHIF